MTHEEKLTSHPESESHDNAAQLAELARLANLIRATEMGLGVVPDERPLPDRFRDCASRMGISFGIQKDTLVK